MNDTTDMTGTDDPDAIRAEIERTRAELSHNVDALTDTANPKNIARRQGARIRSAAAGVRDHVMGSPDDDADQGRAGEFRDAAQERASAIGDAAASAPRRAQQKTRGNPLAAGIIAFGAGLLVSSLIPSSEGEQQAVNTLKERTQPAQRELAAAARQLADDLRGPAQDAAQSVKAAASHGAQNVKDEATSAASGVRDDAQEAKENVQGARASSGAS